MSTVTFVLVLTLIGYNSQSGNSVTSIPGFKSAESCLAAGNAWVKHQRTVHGKTRPDSMHYYTAICVRQ